MSGGKSKVMAVTWVILNVLEDDSYILILETNVVCAGATCRVGEEVVCYYNGVQYTGIVIEKGDHSVLSGKLKTLNKNRRLAKKEDSFHADQPRRAAEKCKSDMKNSIFNRNKKPQHKQNDAPATSKHSKDETASNGISEDEVMPSSSSMTKHSSAKADGEQSGSVGKKDHKEKVDKVETSENSNASSEKILTGKKDCKKRVIRVESSDDSDESGGKGSTSKKDHKRKINRVALSDNSDESSGNEDKDKSFTLKDFKRLQELSKKHKKLDFQSLMILAAKEKQKKLKADVGQGTSKEGPDEVEVEFESEKTVHEVKGKMHYLKKNVKGKVEKHALKYSSDSSSRASSPSQSETEGPNWKKSPMSKLDTSDSKPLFEGKMYQWTVTDEKVEELVEDSGVFIKKSDIKAVRNTCTSATAVARMLVRKVFTLEAQLTCSVSGQEASGKGKAHSEVRPALGSDGVAAIISFAQRRSNKKGWRPVSEAQCRTAMASLLCETRSKARNNQKKAEEMKSKLEQVKLAKEKKGNEDGSAENNMAQD